MPKARTKSGTLAPKKIVKRVARNNAPVIAAVDLGSNSFHLVVAKVEDGKPIVVDRLREMLRFGSGLDRQGHIKPAAAKAALACLRRFGERLTLWRPELVRAVGTNTLRQAAGAGPFLHKAQLKLGVPIEVISGIEEARLIYRGVSPGIEADGHTLVVDIGGGSTEIIVGAGGRPEILESATMGCVTMTDQLLRGHFLTEARFAQAVAAAHHSLSPLQARFREAHWDRALGSSGTIRAVEGVARELGLASYGLTLPILYELRAQVLRQRRADRLVLPGLATERAPVFAGGLAILIALFEALAISDMDVTRGALREGVLQDLIGRLEGTDVRSEAVARLAARWPEPYGPCAASRVADLFGGVAGAWRLTADDGRFLEWAARLHACGTAVNRAHFEQHSAYIISHAELAGFAHQEQEFLGTLVALQAGKWTGAVLTPLKQAFGASTIRLAVLLRLAVALAHLEDQGSVPAVRLAARGSILEIRVMARGAITRDALWRNLTPELSDMQKSGIKFLMVK
ncbi:MAG TPA: Ppx/GppA phosphatase family protein [Acidiferrobacter sp.]|nr:Ppx/GppA phosphatase family protein [Acidiferrobacter sp.]